MNTTNTILNKMQCRVAAGRDPLTGRPRQVKGTVRREGNRLTDDTGKTVVLSKHGDWIYG